MIVGDYKDMCPLKKTWRKKFQCKKILYFHLSSQEIGISFPSCIYNEAQDCKNQLHNLNMHNKNREINLFGINKIKILINNYFSINQKIIHIIN